MTDRPLEGIQVIDLTHVLAGPYCTYQLGLLGADSLKKKTPRGDMVRGWGGDTEQLSLGIGSGFVPQNAGKRSVVFDITTERGSELVRETIRDADIFVENYRPGTMADHGLDFNVMSAINPRLIYVSISAFGQNGPDGHRPGFDDVVQATSGFMSINQRGDGPIRTGGPVLDYATGMHATSAVLAAVLLRQQNGKGQYIDIAMQDVTMLLINRNTSIAASTGEPPPPGSNRDGPLLGRYAVKDGYVMLAGYLPYHQRSILNALGLVEYAALTTTDLRAQLPEIEQAVEETLMNRSAAEWDEIFANDSVVAGSVRDLMAVFESGQPEARELITEVESPAGLQRVTTAGYRMNNEVFGPRGSIPKLGEHTRDVLSELGYSEEDIAELFTSNFVA